MSIPSFRVSINAKICAVLRCQIISCSKSRKHIRVSINTEICAVLRCPYETCKQNWCAIVVGASLEKIPIPVTNSFSIKTVVHKYIA
jgi:hypothetical protein